jgi:hypothetical protein
VAEGPGPTRPKKEFVGPELYGRYPAAGSIRAGSVRDEIHRDPVNAVAQMARWWTIVKDVPKMAAAVHAMNLGSDHAEGPIH